MEEDYTSKLSSQLLIFEKNSKEWEWSDLIKWLSVLKQIIEKYSIPVPPDLVQTLSKRLGQCLSPNLPHGIHSRTLEIYNILLQTTSSSQISALSTGLFPYFQYCTPQNKPQYLELIKIRYIDRFNEIKFLIKGLLSSLLEGANETPDSFQKVCEVLEISEKNNKKMTFEVIWWFILKSPKHRLAGLQYIQKKQDDLTSPEQIECALLESLNDESVINKRNALDYIRLNYPIDQSFPGLINLVQGALHLLKLKDDTLIRRIWEWIYPSEFDEKLVEKIEKIIRPALLELLEANHVKIMKEENADYAKIESITIIENLCEHENIGEVILRHIVIDIVRYTNTDQLFWVYGKEDNRIFNVISSKGSEFFWSAYVEKLENPTVDQLGLDLPVFKYAVQSFGVERIPVKVINNIVLNMSEISEVEIALDLLVSIAKRVNLEEVNISPILSILKKFIQEKNTSKVEKVCKLIKKIPNYELKTASIAKLIKKTIQIDFEIGVILSISLNWSLKLRLIFKMWHELDINKQGNCILLYKAFKHRKDWNLETISFLTLDNRPTEEPFRKFIKFWNSLNKENSKYLHNLCRSTEIIYFFIERLSSDDPVAKLMAREWLDTALVLLENIFDPILMILLKESTKFDLNSDGFYQWHHNFNSTLVEKMLKMIISVISAGSRSLLKRMNNDKLSDYFKSEFNKDSYSNESYLFLLTQLLFMFIQTSTASQFIESPTLNASPMLAVNNIHDVSSDLLILIIKNTSKKICTDLLNKASEILFRVIRYQTRLDIYLLRIIEQMFLFNKPAFSYPSVFSDCLFLGLRKDSKKIRGMWMKIFIQILPKIMTSVKADDLAQYLELLFDNYFESIFKIKDFSLLPGLAKLVNICLNINVAGISVIFSDSTKKIIKNQTSQVVKLIFICYLEDFKDFSFIHDLVTSFKNVFLNRLVKSVYRLWKSFVVPVPFGTELRTIMKMIPNFQLTAEEILEIMMKYMEKHKDFTEDIYVCNFCQHVLMYLESFKIPILKLQIWKRIIKILNRLLSNDRKEAYIIGINILYSLTSKICIEEKLLKDIQDISRVLLIDNFSLILSAKEQAINTVFYLTEVIQEPISKKYLNAIHQRGYHIIEVIWNSNQDKDKNNFQVSFINCLISSLCQSAEDGDIVSDLIQYFLKNPTSSICEGVKRNLIDFIKTNLISFLNQKPTAFKSWKAIINRAALTFYPEKTALLLEIMHECEPGILGSFWSSNTLIKNLYNSSSLLCFLVFSSPKNMYSKLLQNITDKIKEIQKNEDVFDLQKVLLLLCKVLFLKLSSSEFTKIWRLVWPGIHSYITKHLENINITHSFEVLKFMDFILTTNFTENCVLSNFFIDIPEFQIVQEAQTDFQPICIRFLQGFTAKIANYRSERLSSTSIKEKKMILSGKRPETEEDIENFGKSLIQYASCYSSELIETDWTSVETELEVEIIELGSI